MGKSQLGLKKFTGPTRDDNPLLNKRLQANYLLHGRVPHFYLIWISRTPQVVHVPCLNP